MRRSDSFYGKIKRIITEIYQDYGIDTFPVDEVELCKKMGIVLVPYSELNGEELRLAYKRSSDGFYVPRTTETPPMIYYNDNIEEVKCNGRIRYTIFHEIKHYVFDDKEESDEIEDGAQFFAKYLMCPIPYLVFNINDFFNIKSIMQEFGVSAQVANILLETVKRRILRFGYGIFESEIELLDSIYHREFDTLNYKEVLKDNK